jgi:hypothetical protein
MKAPGNRNGSEKRRVRLGHILSVSLAVAAAACIGAAPARADVIVNYQLEDVTLADGGTATGTFAFDSSIGGPVGADIIVTDPNDPNSPVEFDDSDATALFGYYGDSLAIFINSDGFGLTFEDVLGGATDQIVTDQNNSGYDYNEGAITSLVVSGYAADTAPEPASLALFGGGLLGISILIRRRKQASRTAV